MNLKSVGILVCLINIAPSLSFASEGSSSGTRGGGDPYIIDFLKTASQIVYPWLLESGANLNPPVNASEFLSVLDPKKIYVQKHVYESCDEAESGREVAACYSSRNGGIFLSRTLYPIDVNSSSKFGLIAHELFRKMGIEGDDYKITRQLPIAQDVSSFKIGSEQIANLNKAFNSLSEHVDYLVSESFSVPMIKGNEPYQRRIVAVKKAAKAVNDELNRDRRACSNGYNGLKVCDNPVDELQLAIQDLNDHVDFMTEAGLTVEQMENNDAYLRKKAKVDELKVRLAKDLVAN